MDGPAEPPVATRRRWWHVVPWVLLATVVLAVVVATSVLVASTPGHAPPKRAALVGGTVWLCKPGMANDPCTASPTTTVVPLSGQPTVVPGAGNPNPPVDCFYVYGTVSTETTVNANDAVQSAERVNAEDSVARFAPLCRIYAPIYPQLTLSAIDHPAEVTTAAIDTAYRGVKAAWEDYLRHDNDGRGVVVIGQSQGASMLVRLLAAQIDPDPALRRLLVSAILPGANVTVPIDQPVGGVFAHIPACTRADEIGCVISYSSFESTPPADAYFGRVNPFIARFSDSRTGALLESLCTNPAALAGGSGALVPYLPVAAPVDGSRFVEYPLLYNAHCAAGGGASWLDVVPDPSPLDRRPRVQPTLGPRYGLQADDLVLALGNLVAIVQAESALYLGH